MGNFIVEGGYKLKGELIPQGAKNEALQVIVAVLLTKEDVEIHNIPEIEDVLALIKLLEFVGVKVNKIKPNSYLFNAKDINKDFLYTKDYKNICSSFRGSVMLMGPLLGRLNQVIIHQPGGDKIGRRRLDTHFNGISKLNTQFTYNNNEHYYEVKTNELKGAYIHLEEASVTGTANVLMATVKARGKSIIYNAACEPYIYNLCKMLIKMGAKINGVGSNLLEIEGVNTLSGCKHHILPDMIEIGSFISLAVTTGSEIKIKNVSYKNLGIIPETFKKLGANIILKDDDIIIPEHKNYEITKFIDGSLLHISDAPWPGLTPDLISVILVMATQAKGSVLIHQKMFESRLFFVDKLIEMGAQIILCDPHRAVVIGMNRENKLRGLKMSSPDIRAGVALLIAALSAEGESKIDNINQIDRGYQNIDIRLNAIGAKIKRIS